MSASDLWHMARLASRRPLPKPRKMHGPVGEQQPLEMVGVAGATIGRNRDFVFKCCGHHVCSCEPQDFEWDQKAVADAVRYAAAHRRELKAELARQMATMRANYEDEKFSATDSYDQSRDVGMDAIIETNRTHARNFRTRYEQELDGLIPIPEASLKVIPVLLTQPMRSFMGMTGLHVPEEQSRGQAHDPYDEWINGDARRREAKR